MTLLRQAGPAGSGGVAAGRCAEHAAVFAAEVLGDHGCQPTPNLATRIQVADGLGSMATIVLDHIEDVRPIDGHGRGRDRRTLSGVKESD
jgi:hypothetical protein